MARIVVGVDGSAASRRAVAFAVEEARLRDATLDAVIVYEYPPMTFGMAEAMVALPERREFEDAARRTLDDVLRGVAADVRLERIVASGHPRRVLAEASRGADLLVIGSRGLGAVRGLVLGSVSHYLVGHAPCPVAVVDGATETAVDGDGMAATATSA